MICVSAIAIAAKAKTMPPSYLDDCKKYALSQNNTGMWCFTAPDFFKLRRKYRTSSPGQFTEALENRVVRGCCGEAAKTKPL